jgi:hypothetical protein
VYKNKVMQQYVSMKTNGLTGLIEMTKLKWHLPHNSHDR